MRNVICLLILLLAPLPAHAAFSLKARPQSGVGVLVIRGSQEIPLYREPGTGRLALVPVSGLPQLPSCSGAEPGIFHVVVVARRPGWFRVIIDAAESGGWLERRRSMEFFSWADFLAGRRFTMMADLRSDFYLLRSSPSIDAEAAGSIGAVEPYDITSVSGDWLQVKGKGWVRWYDDNSRLLIKPESSR